MRALCCGTGFSLVVVCGFSLSSWGVQAPEGMGSVVCDMRALSLRRGSSVVVVHGLPCGMWDLSSPTRDQTRVPCIGRRIHYHWTNREVPGIWTLDESMVSVLNFLNSIIISWLK